MAQKLTDSLIQKINKFAPSLFGEIEAKEQAEIMATRKEKSAALAKVEADTLTAVQTLLDEQATAQDAVKDAEQVLLEKQRALSDVKSKVWNAKQRGQSQANTLRAYLLETAPPEIDEAVSYFQKKLEWLREPGRISSESGGSKINLVGWKKKVVASTNRPAVESAMRYCQDAIERLELMRLDAELDMKGIEQMKKEIPDTSIYTEIQAERPLVRATTKRAAFS